jgi:hypothetical protein
LESLEGLLRRKRAGGGEQGKGWKSSSQRGKLTSPVARVLPKRSCV